MVKKELKSSLKIRKKIKKRKPSFKRQENKRYKKLKSVWRAPRGIDSKLKKDKKSRGKRVRPGYSSPTAVKGLSRTGHKIVHVSNPGDVDKMHHTTEVAIISANVGGRKRAEILKHAEEKKVHIMNK
ncbi:MAG: 50S ribosomal protein L32e [Nanoarchaeota archaeon]|nr:50S ribosomal protein L32e [Nanoarchaeota archaeon]MBU1135786.1 50S ribosomal protein L32e [Nanoarchaeota archaeon]MBU2519650.1 50S ribosomal protein L32e [Nanoarchaeota archaeon]